MSDQEGGSTVGGIVTAAAGGGAAGYATHRFGIPKAQTIEATKSPKAAELVAVLKEYVGTESPTFEGMKSALEQKGANASLLAKAKDYLDHTILQRTERGGAAHGTELEKSFLAEAERLFSGNAVSRFAASSPKTAVGIMAGAGAVTALGIRSAFKGSHADSVSQGEPSGKTR